MIVFVESKLLDVEAFIEPSVPKVIVAGLYVYTRPLVLYPRTYAAVCLLVYGLKPEGIVPRSVELRVQVI